MRENRTYRLSGGRRPAPAGRASSDPTQPDLLFISRGREHTLTDKNVRGAPDLAIEILSPSTADRDLGYKYDLYGRHGVLEYWIVDPMAETIAVHQQRNGSLELAETFGRRDTLRSRVLEGLHLKLDGHLCELKRRRPRRTKRRRGAGASARSGDATRSRG